MKGNIRNSYTRLIRQVLDLLPEKSYQKLILLTGFQIIATFLDIFALFVLGFLTKAGIEVVQERRANIAVSYFEFFNSMGVVQQFALLSGVVILLFTLRTLFALWGNQKILHFLGVRSAQASSEILRKLFESKPEYVVSKKTQELLYGVTSGVDNLILSYMGSLMLVFSELFFLVAVIGSLIIMQPIAGLCSLVIFGGMGFLIHRLTSKSVKEDAAESGDIAVSYSQQLLETLHLYREHFLRGSISDATIDVQKLRRRYLEIRAKLLFLPVLSKYLFEFVLILGGAAVAIIQFLITDMTGAISSLVLFLGASSRVLPSVVRVQGALLTVKQSEGASRITLQQLNEFDLNKVNSHVEFSVKLSELKESNYIVVENVSFRYPEQRKDALNNLTFSVGRGQFVAIVGESGAGKSTLADVLLGIQEPCAGKVTINGISPREFVAQNPGALGYVPQDIAILDGTIMKNVTLSQEKDLNWEQLINSLQRAALWRKDHVSQNFIESIVGERGMKLSGGQRQRLGIARALYSNPELIVFDEATSSLDPKTEKTVTDAIYRNQGKVTLIVIAHRLSTVKNADLVLLLDKGHLVASGNFQEVRAKVPKFDEQVKLINL